MKNLEKNHSVEQKIIAVTALLSQRMNMDEFETGNNEKEYESIKHADKNQQL